MPVPLDALALPKPDPERLVGFLKAMEFNTLTRRIAQMLHVDPEAVRPDPSLLPEGAESASRTRRAAATSPRSSAIRPTAHRPM